MSSGFIIKQVKACWKRFIWVACTHTRSYGKIYFEWAAENLIIDSVSVDKGATLELCKCSSAQIGIAFFSRLVLGHHFEFSREKKRLYMSYMSYMSSLFNRTSESTAFKLKHHMLHHTSSKLYRFKQEKHVTLFKI